MHISYPSSTYNSYCYSLDPCCLHSTSKERTRELTKLADKLYLIFEIIYGLVGILYFSLGNFFINHFWETWSNFIMFISALKAVLQPFLYNRRERRRVNKDKSFDIIHFCWRRSLLQLHDIVNLFFIIFLSSNPEQYNLKLHNVDSTIIIDLTIPTVVHSRLRTRLKHSYPTIRKHPFKYPI